MSPKYATYLKLRINIDYRIYRIGISILGYNIDSDIALKWKDAILRRKDAILRPMNKYFAWSRSLVKKKLYKYNSYPFLNILILYWRFYFRKLRLVKLYEFDSL